MVLLLPKLQSLFAEFLQYAYLKRLNLFNLSTCVGFSTVFCLSCISWKWYLYLKHLLFKGKIYTLRIKNKKYLIRMSLRSTFLKDRFSQRGLSFLWKPRTFGDNVFKILHYLSLLMLALSSLVNHIFSQKCFEYFQSVPLPSRLFWIRSFGIRS